MERRADRGSCTGASICGVGAVTGYGWGRKRLWDGLTTGESAVALHAGFAPYIEGDKVWGAQVPPEGGDPADGVSRYPRALAYAVREAIADAMQRGWEPGPTVGLVHSVVLGDVELWGDFHRAGVVPASKSKWVSLMPSTTLSKVMKEHGLHGPCMSVSAMCASGTAGLITAKMWLDAGIVNDVVCVATDLSGAPENMRYFRDLGVMVLDAPAEEACRPFQKGSRGFNGGEASVAMVLSGRPEGSYATLLGGAMTHDGHHVISIAADHKEIFRCFRESLDNAGVSGGEIAYLNAHGPGTRQCDRAEAHVLNELLVNLKGVFSVKPLTGHCQSAAASVEVLASLYAFETGMIPAPRRVAPGHPKLLDGLTPREPGLVLKSSIGMGGYNTAVVLDEPEP